MVEKRRTRKYMGTTHQKKDFSYDEYLELLNQGKTKKWADETWEEFFFDIYWDKYFIVNDELYQILEVEDIDSCYYVQVDKQDDDTYSFYATYYDGGTCLTECLEEGIENLK